MKFCERGRVEPTERRVQVFNDLKQFLTSPLILELPHDNGDYILDCDASLVGAGAVLQQFQAGKLRVIEYAYVHLIVLNVTTVAQSVNSCL